MTDPANAGLSDIDRIRRVVAQYSQLLDDQRFEEWGDLFTEDAEFSSVPGGHLAATGPAAVFQGRAAIVAAISAVQRRLSAEHLVLHFGGNPIIDVAGRSARAWWDFMVLYLKAGGTEIAHAGRYYATLRHEDGRWRFTRRVSVRPGHAPPEDLAPTPGR